LIHNQITSSSIKSAGFDPKTGEMEVEFQTGRKYRYQNVPQGTYDSFVNAKSQGKFFGSEIRPLFKFEKAEDD